MVNECCLYYSSLKFYCVLLFKLLLHALSFASVTLQHPYEVGSIISIGLVRKWRHGEISGSLEGSQVTKPGTGSSNPLCLPAKPTSLPLDRTASMRATSPGKRVMLFNCSLPGIARGVEVCSRGSGVLRREQSGF